MQTITRPEIWFSVNKVGQLWLKLLMNGRNLGGGGGRGSVIQGIATHWLLLQPYSASTVYIHQLVGIHWC